MKKPACTISLRNLLPAFLTLLMLGVACTERSNGDRTLLTRDDLLAGSVLKEPVENSAFVPPADAGAPQHTFTGRLQLASESDAGRWHVVMGESDQLPDMARLPAVAISLVQSEGYLIPVQRGLIITDHPVWNILFEPGRVWSEGDDAGYSRASLPFALIPKDSNATYNGLLTFLYDDEIVSPAWYQVTQETGISLHLDLWGSVATSRLSHPETDVVAVQSAFARELANRLPSRSFDQLAEDYPGVDVTAFGRGVTPENMTWYGFVVDGINYVGGCMTRTGPYPYCESMRAPSYSTAKSAFISVALMRLAQLHGLEVAKLLIQDYLPETAASAGDWQAVTFEDALDMGTGNFRSAGHMVDEEQWDSDPFWLQSYYDERLQAALNWPHSAPPGQTWVYRTSDTFILSSALQNFLESVAGPDADLFEFVVDEVYRPSGIGPGAYTTLRTQDDNWQGLPLGGYGLWWIPDDLARLAKLLNVDEGVVAGEQRLHPALLAAALQRTSSDRGVPRGPGGMYNNAFWADRFAGFSCDVWVASMLGYSGIVVALFPNGTAYYYASDGREFTWEAALREADKIAPLCPSSE